jgi:hypothetical protein
LGLPNLPPVPYVRSARFETVSDARACYRRIYDACVGPDKRYDLGVVSALRDSHTPVVVVTALEMPPEEVQRTVTETLASGESWSAPDDLVAAIVLRRLRQMLAGQGSLQPSGYRLFEQHGKHRQVDRWGRDA